MPDPIIVQAETDLPAFEALIKDFERQPKVVLQSTYLELCKYPASRFEEVCTRLLCFYFNPTNEHGFRDLFLDALLELLSPDAPVRYESDQIQVINELNSEGKRLDMLIKSPDLVIGIENKINAAVYNPLETYARQIALYGKKQVFKVILTVRNITDSREMAYIREHDFIVIPYTALFTKIKKNIGNYIAQGNQKYLVFIYDFIQTIENMTGDTYDNNKLSHFFSANAEKIDELVTLYAKYNERILKVQRESISKLMAAIKLQTNDPRWWAYQGWDLGYDHFNAETNKPRIGIEASFETINNNPLAKFRIYITTWNLKDFVPYEDVLTELFPTNHLDKTNDGRVFLHMDVIDDLNEELILEKLAFYYQLLYKIVAQREG